jgi:hypothetical protein
MFRLKFIIYKKGVSYSAQYSNPKKIIDLNVTGLYSGDSPQTIPQPEPNGIWMPESSNSTWLMMIDENGEPRAQYWEPKIVVSPFPIPGIPLE